MNSSQTASPPREWVRELESAARIYHSKPGDFKDALENILFNLKTPEYSIYHFSITYHGWKSEIITQQAIIRIDGYEDILIAENAPRS